MKFEFGDLYKFIVSLGVILLTLSILGPWLFLREPFDLQIKAADLTELTETAQKTIARRQEIVLIATKVWPWLSPICALTGLILIVIGIRSWRQNQKHLDEKTAAETELAKHQLRSATAQEIEANRQAETNEPVTVEEMETGNVQNPSPNTIWVETEQVVAEKISMAASRHDVLPEQKFGDEHFDIVLMSTDKFTKNYIVEIKYLNRAFSYTWLRQTACQVRQQATVFAQTTNTLPNTALLIVLSDSAWNADRIEQQLDRLKNDLRRRGGKHCVQVITKTQLDEISPKDLMEMLRIHS